MQTVQLGRTGRRVTRIGLGGMPLSIQGRPERGQAKAVIRRAVELGVNFIDTADVYCLDDDDIGHNERLIAETLDELGARDDVTVATKGGLTRPEGRDAVVCGPAQLGTVVSCPTARAARPGAQRRDTPNSVVAVAVES